MLTGWTIMKITHHKCLILNADYSPIGIINWQKAMVWAFKFKHNYNNIEIIEYYDPKGELSEYKFCKIHQKCLKSQDSSSL